MPRSAINLGFLLIDGFGLMSYASVVEPFRAANTLSGQTLYKWANVSLDGRAIRASSGASISADAKVGDALDIETLFVVAGGDPTTFNDRAAFAWLRKLARSGVRIAGVSGGPFILAAAGVLEGHRCTIHWEHVPAFQERFPMLTLEPNLYVIDRNRLTAAGGMAAFELVVELIEREHGHKLAVQVSEWFIHTHMRMASGAQRMSLRERYAISNDRVLKVLARMEARIEDPESRGALVRLAGVSLCQLERLFMTHLGATISDTYLRIRLEHAQALLRTTGMSITDISVACGFTSPSHFSRAFKTKFGASPKASR